jgi:hypothetical protein
MKRFAFFPTLFLLSSPMGWTQSPAAGALQYNRDIRPILSDNCFACHGPDKSHRDSDLRLDIREEAIRPAKSGMTAIVPGQAAKSELIARIFTEDEDDIMPPPKAHKILTAAQKNLLKQWVDEGAIYEPHWAYVPLARPAVPTLPEGKGVVSSDPSASPIDVFVQAPLLARGFAPSPEADRAVLLRRLSLDLTGLPPTPEELDTFVKDQDANAYGKQVDRLLASPHYGERMAQFWLDAVRYADTVGFHGDQNQNVWAYRDYVIDSFAKNKPFDQFTIEQIAGDMLPEPTEEQWIATCFNRLNMMTREGGAQPKEYLAIYTADRVRTVGMAWLGSTMGCAECHDHKFDPITQKDFYSMAAFFGDVKQWGVYQNYGYTPNPDLAGFTNEHPFPPERVVGSKALEEIRQSISSRMESVATKAVGSPVPWITSTKDFLQKNPTGWFVPEALKVQVGKSVLEKKGAAITAPEGWQWLNDSVLMTGKEVGPITVDMTVPEGLSHVAALRVEFLPHESHAGKITRDGSASFGVTFGWELIGDGGKPAKMGLRHVQANEFARKYRNGYELIGVKDGWTTDAAKVSEAHVAVCFPDRPVAVKAGHTIRLVLGGKPMPGLLRVSLSPLAPVIDATAFAETDLALTEGSPATAVSWLRATSADQAAFDALKVLDGEMLPTRGGKTPVLVTERTDKPLTIRLLARGSWQDESGPIMQPETLHFLPKPDGYDPAKGTRMDLARWLVSPENPLTARVIMNRLWKQLFGNGLSLQADDFGAQGESPSHPELLDWLAVEFREGGWDYRAMVKRIVMSHTYRQTSSLRPEFAEINPNNRWLSSQNPRRLEAEAVRDNALSIAGLLNKRRGGPPSFPYQPADYYAGLQFPDRIYQADAGEGQYRRGIYTHWQRTFLHPMLANFDAPSREDCLVMRTNANTPQQALTLLNDPSFVEAARHWAGRLAKAAPDESARLDLAFREALARAPSPEEKASLLEALGKLRSEYKAKPEDAINLLQTGQSAPTEGAPEEMAAWTNLCRIILNLHEVITRY